MRSSSPWRDVLCLTLFFSLLFGVFLGTRPLMTPDEGRYAEIPREMVESGDYLTPRLNYIKYFEKPPFFYWMTAASIKVFGLNNWSLRLMVAISAWLGCCMAYWGGLKLFGRRTGILAFLILCTSLLYFIIGRTALTDMPFSVWMSACLLLFLLGQHEKKLNRKRYYFWGMYISSALAVLTKGLAGVLLPGFIVFLWICITHSWRDIKTYCIPSGIILFLLVAGPWHIEMQLHHPEFFHFYFIEQHFLRYFTDYAGRQQGLWFIPAVTILGFFPWTCFGMAFVWRKASSCNFLMRFKALLTPLTRPNPFPLIRPSGTFSHEGRRICGPWLNIWGTLSQRKRETWGRNNYANQLTLFLIIWASVISLFFTFSQSQLIPYAVPIIPPLALLVANALSQEWDNSSSIYIRRGFSFTAVLGGCISIALGVFLYLHPADASTRWVLGGILTLLCTCFGSLLIYRRFGTLAAFITLIGGISVFLILADTIYGKVGDRSIKPLALVLIQQAKTEPTKEIPVASYWEYYQDLPVYLKQRVRVVKYEGELEFGIQHQDTQAWIMNDETFWQRWRQPNKMFMITPLDVYEKLKKGEMRNMLYPISQTNQNILLSNQP